MVRAVLDRHEGEAPFTEAACPANCARAADEAYRPYSFHRLAAPFPEVAEVLGHLSFDVYTRIWGDRGEFEVTGVLRDWDRLDDLTSVETAVDMGRRISRAQVVVFEESGHFTFLEEPEKSLSEVRSFLRTPV